MSKYESKHWLATWETNVKQKKLPTERKLKMFLDQYTDFAVFQLERGELKGKEHFQIGLTLRGNRKSKKALLDTFKLVFDNVDGLSLRIAHNKDAVFEYCSKQETRVGETYYAGAKELYDRELSNMELKPWQKDLVDFLKSTMSIREFRDRKIIWVEDDCGNTGKSALVKYLVAGQKDIRSYKLPVSSVDRLNSAVTKITQKEKVDLFLIDLTRSKGKEQSYGDLFAAIEDIKNGHVVDVMYGNYVQAIFKPPQIVIFTNMSLSDYRYSLSEDRWLHLIIFKHYETKELELKCMKCIDYNQTTKFIPVREITKKLSGSAPTPPDENFKDKKGNSELNDNI